ncbi:diaminopimelate decarboxylase [Agromyces italicus]|uniref:diaminopimelate decarboxylase n=1 Tax=Agromyces italicus TaxID=279572 RepID=UPI0003B58146|nr:diaminopimelate decarboxylase [Agromyces italicus]
MTITSPAELVRARLDADLELFPAGTRRTADGDISISGCSLRALADEYGTPALIIDEAALRARAAEFLRAFRTRHAATDIHFASKAFPSAAVLGVLAEEGLNFDVASGNEFSVARAAGVDPSRMLLHGNAKTDEEIRLVTSSGIGHIVIDNLDDVERIARIATTQVPVLLRVTPGIDAQTHEATATGHNGSKFGVSMEDAPAAIERIQSEPSMRLDGLHAHIGSQIFELKQFQQEVAALSELPRFPLYDLGGGLASRYTSEDPSVSIDDYAQVLVSAVHEHLGHDVRLMVEPGRSMVASTGVSLYRVVTVKRGHRTHVAVDGGMGDNLEASLYGQRFQPWLLGTDPRVETYDLVGHHCESGDVLVRDAVMPTASIGDLAVVPVTGAYTFTMSNNYNAAFRPPVVFCTDGTSRLAVRRETMSDLLAREVLL